MLLPIETKMLRGKPQRVHKCELCPASYFQLESLQFHREVHHGKQDDKEEKEEEDSFNDSYQGKHW